jgi:hypothetical protein
MAVAGELRTSRLCSSSFFVFFFPLPSARYILRLFIIFFYVHTFDDAWYVEICSSKPPTGSIYKPSTIYKEVLLNRSVFSTDSSDSSNLFLFFVPVRSM